VCQFLLSANSGKPIAATNHRTDFQRKIKENISYECELAFRYQFFAAEAPSILRSQIHILAEAAETFFCDLKSKFPLNKKIKYQQFNGK
jgi:hypothetical protein